MTTKALLKLTIMLAGVAFTGCVSTTGYRSEVSYTPLPAQQRYRLAVSVTETRRSLFGSEKQREVFSSPGSTWDVGEAARLEFTWDEGRSKVVVEAAVPTGAVNPTRCEVRVTEAGRLRHAARFDLEPAAK